VGDITKLDLRDIGWGGMDWSDLAQDRGKWMALVNASMNIIIIYLSCKWVFTRWQCTTIRHKTQITHITQTQHTKLHKMLENS
jgi:hypothetical protein